MVEQVPRSCSGYILVELRINPREVITMAMLVQVDKNSIYDGDVSQSYAGNRLPN